MPSFVGRILDEETKEMIEVDEEAYNETPDYVVIPNENGGKCVDLESQNADEGGMMDFYVANVETKDGRIITITSNDLDEDLRLVFDDEEDKE